MSVLRAARRLTLGLALAAAVTLFPAQPAAAEPAGVSVRAADLWQAAVEWLAAWWSPAVPESNVPGGGGASSAEACQGDQGACVDPNG
jgi:hypothetical protein